MKKSKKREQVWSAGHEVAVHTGNEDMVYDFDGLNGFFVERGFRPYHRNRLYQLEVNGQFPHRVRLGLMPFSRVGWLRSEIHEWFRERMESRPENRWKPASQRTADVLEES